MVEGTPLLREHLGKTRIEGSNPSVSVKIANKIKGSRRFCFLAYPKAYPKMRRLTRIRITSALHVTQAWRLYSYKLLSA